MLYEVITIIGAKLQKAGERFDLMDPGKMGIRFVANSVITTRKMLEERPETVKRFTRALLQGWRDALAPDREAQAIELLLKYDKETPEEIVRQQLPATRILRITSYNVCYTKLLRYQGECGVSGEFPGRASVVRP